MIINNINIEIDSETLYKAGKIIIDGSRLTGGVKRLSKDYGISNTQLYNIKNGIIPDKQQSRIKNELATMIIKETLNNIEIFQFDMKDISAKGNATDQPIALKSHQIKEEYTLKPVIKEEYKLNDGLLNKLKNLLFGGKK